MTSGNDSTLSGKTALVTGASKGIGAGIALSLGRAGANVVVNYATSRSGGDDTVRRIEATGGQAVAIGANIAIEEEVDALYDHAAASFGTLDILVNNAAIFQPGPLKDSTAQSFHDQFNVNVLGLLLSSKRFAAQADAGASIVNISSNGSQLAPMNLGIYAATKAAVNTLTKVHSKELGPRGIRVNAICPGLVVTEATRNNGLVDSSTAAAIIEQTPLRRAGQPDDIAAVATFLASDEARWLTGQIITASGGI